MRPTTQEKDRHFQDDGTPLPREVLLEVFEQKADAIFREAEAGTAVYCRRKSQNRLVATTLIGEPPTLPMLRGIRMSIEGMLGELPAGRDLTRDEWELLCRNIYRLLLRNRFSLQRGTMARMHDALRQVRTRVQTQFGFEYRARD